MKHKRSKGKKHPASELITILQQMKTEANQQLHGDKFTKSAKQSVTIEGWIARDKDDDAICLFGKEPERLDCGIWHTFATGIILPTDSFPDIKWEDEPLKVKLTIEEI